MAGLELHETPDGGSRARWFFCLGVSSEQRSIDKESANLVEALMSAAKKFGSDGQVAWGFVTEVAKKRSFFFACF